ADWQGVDSQILSSSSINSKEYLTNLNKAESSYWVQNPWRDGESIFDNQVLTSNDTSHLADLKGPAYIENLHFQFPTLDTAILKNLWIEMRWDESPSPSVSMPLSDFFGISTGIR